MKKKILWIIFPLLSILISLYPLKYLFGAGTVGILNNKPDSVLSSLLWNIAFYTHISLGGIALFMGWIQFSTKLKMRRPRIHKTLGKIYTISVLLSAISAFFIAMFADEGPWASLGFSCLSIIWFYTTLMAYLTIKKKQLVRHQFFMIYSYAACFAAVTLRIWLPVLILTFGNYSTAYIIVAWLSWIPNILVAYLIVYKLRGVYNAKENFSIN